MKLVKVTVSVGFLIFVAGCGKDKKGDSLGLPQVKPPVERNAPAGLRSTSTLALQGAKVTSLSTLGSRFFSGGPTSIMDILGKIDQALLSLDQRSQEDGNGRPACLSNEATAWTAKLPTGNATYYLQCYEESQSAETSSSRKMAFGIKDEYVYLVNLQESTGSVPRAANLIKAKMDGTLTEAWITMQKFDLSQSVSTDDFFFLNVKADDTTKAFEFSVGGTGKGIGVDCGVRVRSNGSSVYASGILASFGDRGVETCSGVASSTSTANSTSTNVPRENLCVDATSISSVAETQCSGINTFTVPELTHLDLKADGKAMSSAIIESTISGVTTFAPGT